MKSSALITQNAHVRNLENEYKIKYKFENDSRGNDEA
jgi:hypothetical protein